MPLQQRTRPISRPEPVRGRRWSPSMTAWLCTLKRQDIQPYTHILAHVLNIKLNLFSLLVDFSHPDLFGFFFSQVRTLESKNKQLEAEIDVLKSRHAKPSGLRQLYESQLKDLSRVAEQMKVQRVREIIIHDCNAVLQIG